MTSVNFNVDAQSQVLSDSTQSASYQPVCDLLYFGDPTVSGGVISLTPSVFQSDFNCVSGTQTTSLTIPLNSSEITIVSSHITGQNNTIAFMVFPNFNATLRGDMDSNNWEYGVANFLNQFNLEADGGFYCMFVKASGMCNIFYEPWEAVKDVLGEDYVGDWFYVMIFLPLPMSIFLTTRSGLYAGFSSLSMMLVIQTIDTTIFEVSLSMILIAAGFGFYEVLRKRLVQGG